MRIKSENLGDSVPRSGLLLCFLALLLLMVPATAEAYPEFQTWVKDNSGRNVDCSLCHAHPNGPDGMKSGQIGSLSPAEMEELNAARRAFEPGNTATSPILNAFGDQILQTVGKKQILSLRKSPGDLAGALDPDSDMDHDGISDAEEYLDGTHPLKNQSGDPWKLFSHNFVENAGHILLLALATIFGIYGINNLLHWFDAETQKVIQGHEEESKVTAGLAVADYSVPSAIDRPPPPNSPEPAEPEPPVEDEEVEETEETD